MDTAIQHWKILRQLPKKLANRVRTFMVIGENGDGVMLVTNSGDGYWLGEMRFGFGDKESKQVMEPTRLDVSNLTSMAQGYKHILMLDESGQIHAMGQNNFGQLGLGTVDQQTYFSPQLISAPPHKFTSIRCGGYHSVALTKDGKVWAWGGNYWGQVGVPRSTATLHPTPAQILELDPHRVIAVECGGAHSLALTDQGNVYVWGYNDCREFGNVSKSYTHIPTRIPASSPVQSMAAGCWHTLLLTQSGEVYVCGNKEKGQLGLPTNTKSSLIKVPGLPSISRIASHFYTSLSIAMSADKRCFAWGCFENRPFISTPLQLPPIFSSLDSVLSFRSTQCNTRSSVLVEGPKCSQRTESETETETMTEPNRLGKSNAEIFDNPDSNPDVKFELGNQFILAHQSVLQISSAYFAQFFLEFSSSNGSNPLAPIFQSSPSSFRHTTNPSEPNPNWHTTNPSEPNPNWHTTNPSEPNPNWHTANPSEPNPNWHTTNPSEPNLQIAPISPLITIPIPNHSYPTFYAYLRFLYTKTLQVPDEHLPELFELALSYLEFNLEQLCLSRMRSTISLENCCLYYQITERHSLPEFQQELLQFIADNISQVFFSDAFRSLDGDLCKKLSISIGSIRQ